MHGCLYQVGQFILIMLIEVETLFRRQGVLNYIRSVKMCWAWECLDSLLHVPDYRCHVTSWTKLLSFDFPAIRNCNMKLGTKINVFFLSSRVRGLYQSNRNEMKTGGKWPLTVLLPPFSTGPLSSSKSQVAICSWWWWTVAASVSLWLLSPWRPLKSGISFFVWVQLLQLQLVKGKWQERNKGAVSKRKRWHPLPVFGGKCLSYFRARL